MGRANSWWVGWLNLSVLLGSFSSFTKPAVRTWPLRLPLASVPDFKTIPRLHCLRRQSVILLLARGMILPLYPLAWHHGNLTSLPCRDRTDGLLSLFSFYYSGEREAQRRRKLLVQKLPSRRELLWNSYCRENNPVGVPFSVVLLLAWPLKLYCFLSCLDFVSAPA